MPIQPQCSQSRPALLPLLVAFLLPLLLAVLSCGSLNSKPSTTAPGIPGDSADFWDACEEREQAIDAWLERQKRQMEDDYLDGADLFRSAARYNRDEREAETMKRELDSNCKAKWYQSLPENDPSYIPNYVPGVPAWRQNLPKDHRLYDPKYDPSSPEFDPP